MSVKELKKILKKSKSKDEFENGTVIRWTSSDRYTYVAVKTVAGWFTSAQKMNMFVDQVLDFEGLIEVLSRSETSNIEVAVAWESI